MLASVVVAIGGCSSASSGPDAAVDVDVGADLDAAADGGTEDDGSLPDGSRPSPGLWIDGEFDDWTEVPVLATDPSGDATGAFDVTRVKATSRGSVLYLSLELSHPLNLGAGASTDGTLRLELELPGEDAHMTVDFREREASIGGSSVSWAELGHLVLPTHGSDRFEMTFDLSRLGAAAGSDVDIDFTGSDQLAEPVRFTLVGAAQPPLARTAAREPETTFRLASFNVLLDGLLDPARGPQIGRLLAGVRADIYCFQEAYQPQAAILAEELRGLDPHHDGAEWHVFQNIDLLIASRGALHPLPVGPTDGWHAAAVVELAPGQAALVLNIHPPCCGYSGSSQVDQRVAVTRGMVAQIETFRRGGYGAPLDQWRDAPVIVVGDWNLVGSREPLDLMTDPSGPALERWRLRHLVSGHTYTSRPTPDKPSSYPPGVLDLLVHSPGLLRRNGFVLQSEELAQAELQQLGVEHDDSFASDHLMLVADFQLGQ